MPNLDANFHARLSELQAHAANQAAAMQSDLPSAWYTPGFAASAFEPLSLAAPHSGLSRQGVNQQYRNALLTTGRIGEAMSLRVQGDTLSRMERALRLRHATTVRRRAWSASRLAGHASAYGIHGQLKRYAQNLLVSAYTESQTPAVADVVAIAEEENRKNFVFENK